MSAKGTMRAAEVLLDVLEAAGVTRVFGVPGESYLALLDALHDRRARLDFVTCRHEANAANMAEATAKLTGRPGVVAVTRGPGAAHAAIGLHTAFQDSTPLVCLVGQVARAMRDREAFQEIDYHRFLSEVTKWTGEVGQAGRMAEYALRAVHCALSGRQGPVALALPEDMLGEPSPPAPCSPLAPVQAAPDAREVETIAARLAAARRPLILVGGGPWEEAEARALQRAAEAARIPIAASFRAQSLIDNESLAWAGHLGIGADPALVQRLRTADLVVAIGPRLGEMTTDGYARLPVPAGGPPLIHVHAGAQELGRVYRPERAVLSAPGRFAAALADALDRSGAEGRSDWFAAARADEIAWRTPIDNPGAVQIARFYRTLRVRLPEEAILANGAGNYAAFLHRFFVYRGFRTQLAPTSGAMGYAVPAGIAAALAHPDRPVVAVAGDGCFMMAAQELATAAATGARVVFVVMNNRMYGTIRMHQERDFPGRISGTDLVNPDFVALAESFGLPAWRIARDDEVAATLDRALAHEGPSLIEVMVDPRAIAPGRTLETAHEG